MKKFLIVIILVLISMICCGQTVIEMLDVGDAQLILFEIDNKDSADVVIYKTDNKDEYQSWDCMWKFKSWGFSNFSIFIAKNELELISETYDGEYIQYKAHATIYFTTIKEERGYRNENIRLPGIMRILKF